MDTQLIVKNVRLNQMTEMIKRCRSSGLTRREWCRQNNISEYIYYYWQRKAREAVCKDQEVEFTELRLPPICETKTGTDHNPRESGLIIKISGAAIEVGPSASAETLRMVLRELRDAERS